MRFNTIFVDNLVVAYFIGPPCTSLTKLITLWYYLTLLKFDEIFWGHFRGILWTGQKSLLPRSFRQTTLSAAFGAESHASADMNQHFKTFLNVCCSLDILVIVL